MVVEGIVDTLANPAINTFLEEYLGRSRPLLVRGGVSDWKAVADWDFDYLVSRVGDKEVDVSESVNGYFDLDQSNGGVERCTKMSFRNFIESIDEGKEKDRKLYLQQASLAKCFPEICGDISEISYIPKRQKLFQNLWIGSKSNISPLHYDPANNFLAQISGQKSILLADPASTKNLYPFGGMSGAPHVSQVRFPNPDIEKFPKVKGVKLLSCTIDPGDMLYIPPGWWHQVETLRAGVSVNTWWKPSLRHMKSPSMIRAMYVFPPLLFKSKLRNLRNKYSAN